MTDWIPVDEWASIVRNVPIPSVDLVVIHNNGIVLAKRTNEPAKGEWFVPGGRILKNEAMEEAVHRIAEQELGVSVEIIENLGAFDHFYDVSDIDGTSKHYVAHGYVVKTQEVELSTDDQHSELKVFNSIPPYFHNHIIAYLEAADTISGFNF